MVALSLIVYLGLTCALLLPFVLRYLFVLHHEKNAAGHDLSVLPTQRG